MKTLQKILVIFLAVIVIFGLLKNILIKGAVESGARLVTGAPVKIDSLSVGIFRPRVEIKGFKMYNPADFPQEVMVDIPHVRVVYDLPALLTGKLHLPEMTLRMKELVLIKDKQGKLNVDSLKVAQPKEQPKTKPEEKKPAQQMLMQLDEVNLSLGQVILKDYSQGEPPSVSAWQIGVEDKTYKNITSAQQLVALVMTQAMGPTALKSAGMYAAATVLGVGFLPAGVAGVLMGKDNAADTFAVPYQTAYQKTKEVLAASGEIIREEQGQGLIAAKSDGADITVSILDKGGKTVEITVKARKLFMPKAEIAAGILYQISEKLK